MMNNLEWRREHWDRRGARGPEGGHDENDSLPYPFETAGIQIIFHGKNVLEIGPGNGRQYDRLKSLSRSYSVCDIAPSALAEPAFKDTTNHYLLTGWDQNLGATFDVIHFWYVLHHIRHDELREFFDFVNRHLSHGGLVAFNGPEPINVQGDPMGDGIGTTWTNPHIIQASILGSMEMLMALQVDKKSTGFVYLLRHVD